MMLGALLTDHVALASPLEAIVYVGAIVLWLVGVGVIVYRKFRTAR